MPTFTHRQSQRGVHLVRGRDHFLFLCSPLAALPVQILTIAPHDKMAFFKKQFEEKRQDWPLLDLGDNILLLEAYNVRTFPEYILIGRGNKIGQAPAPSPERHLDERVRGLYKK